MNDNLIVMDEEELEYFLSKLEHSDNSFDEELEEHQNETNNTEDK